MGTVAELTGNDLYVYQVGLVTTSIVIWGSFFHVFRKMFSHHEPEFALRILSTIHSIVDITFVILLYKMFESEAQRFRYEKFFLANTIGYVLLDFSFCVHHDMESLIQLLNHIILLATFSIYLFREKLRLIIATGYAVLESTDPILQLRWFLKQNGKSFTFVEYIFILAFIATRVGVFSYYGFYIIKSDVAEQIDKVVMVLNYAMGLIFVINIVRYLIRKYKEKADESKQKTKTVPMAR